MDPDLVGTAGLQAALHMGIAGIAAQDGVMGHRPPAVFPVNGHLLPVHRVAADGGVHGALVLFQTAHRHRLIGAGQGVVLELLGQSQVGAVVFGGDDQPRGVPVDAVDDPRPQHAVDPGQGVAAVVEQGVDQGAVRVSGGGVDHQAHRLVDHDHVSVLIDHVQGNILGHHIQRLRVREGDFQLLSGAQTVIFPQGLTPQGDHSLLQQLLGGRPGQVREASGQKGVGAFPLPVSGERYGRHGASPWAPACPSGTDSRLPPRCRLPPRRCPPH